MILRSAQWSDSQYGDVTFLSNMLRFIKENKKFNVSHIYCLCLGTRNLVCKIMNIPINFVKIMTCSLQFRIYKMFRQAEVLSLYMTERLKKKYPCCYVILWPFVPFRLSTNEKLPLCWRGTIIRDQDGVAIKFPFFIFSCGHRAVYQYSRSIPTDRTFYYNMMVNIFMSYSEAIIRPNNIRTKQEMFVACPGLFHPRYFKNNVEGIVVSIVFNVLTWKFTRHRNVNPNSVTY